MKIKLNDTLHFSDIRREPFVAGDTLDVPAGQAKSLIDRGLARKVEGSSRRNKAQGASPSNKAEGRSRANKSTAIKPIGAGLRK